MLPWHNSLRSNNAIVKSSLEFVELWCWYFRRRDFMRHAFPNRLRENKAVFERQSIQTQFLHTWCHGRLRRTHG